jgi:uncharacterized protein (TIGR02145 family)
LLAAAFGAWLFFNGTTAKPLSVSGADVDIQIPQSYKQPLVVSLGTSSLTVTPVAAVQTQAVQKGNQYTYHDAYPETDVVQTKDKYKIKEELQFRQAGHPTEFKYSLGNFGSFRIEKDADGNYVFYAQNSESTDLGKLFTIPAPFVLDARGNRSTEAVTSSITGGLLTVSIDKNWLAKAVYPVILDPTIEINIINVHSHPMQGQNWEVDFTTQGQADLKIIPNDQATVNDDQFVGLWCGDTQATPQILEYHTIFYPNWSCANTAKVVFYTQTAGNHTLRFEFGGQLVYAYNSAPALSGVTIRGGVKVLGGTGIVTKIASAPSSWTCGTGTVTDYNGNIYNTVLEGTRCWMASNLLTTTDPSGNAITSYCHTSGCGSPWGRLYTWAVAMNNAGTATAAGAKIQGICPAGWHIPSDYGSTPAATDDFSTLVSYVSTLPSCSGVEGKCLKEAGNTDWTYFSSDSNGTDTSNFTGIPAGYRIDSGLFYNRGVFANFWSSFQFSTSNAAERFLYYSSVTVGRSTGDKLNGYSVRCVKD